MNRKRIMKLIALTLILSGTIVTMQPRRAFANDQNIQNEITNNKETYVKKSVKPYEQEKIDVNKLYTPKNVSLVDEKATKETASLYAYLIGVGKTDNVIYGHQNDTHHKAVLKNSKTNSDTKDLTGSISGICGIDALSLTGSEMQLTDEDKSNGVQDLITKASNLGIEASNEGSIITLSCHMPNFELVYEKGKVNGKYDYSGYTPNVTTYDVVSRIMPGGDLNEVYNGYLDMIAEYANKLKDAGVPVLFRPFHENNGSWFWWGKAFCSEEGYKNLYKYTVEYLRDSKDVHNMLYVYSPNGPFENEDDYLSRYPGDEFVDILAFDMYHDNPIEDSNEDPWFDSFKETINLVQGIAEKRDKLSTVSETGIRVNYGSMPVSGNTNKEWFSYVSKIVSQSDMPYYMVWANFDGEKNFFAPYLIDDNKGHEMINDFIDYYNENNSIFADGNGNYKEIETNIKKSYSYGYITSPSARSRVLKQCRIAAKVKGYNEDIKFVVKDKNGKIIDTISADVKGNECTAYLTEDTLKKLGKCIGRIELYSKDKLLDSISALFNIPEEKENPEVVDNFESYYGDDSLLNIKWAANAGPGCKVDAKSNEDNFSEGNYGLAFNYKISTEKADEGYAGITKSLNADWSNDNALSFWCKPDGYGQKLVIQITSNGEDFEVHLPEFTGTTEAKKMVIPFSEFKGKNNGTLDLSKIERMGIWCNTIPKDGEVNSWNVESTMYFDDIKATNTENN